jgi:hypothetical protein
MSKDIIPFYNKLTERINKLPEITKPQKELVNGLQESVLDLASIVYVLYCRLEDLKKECEKL